MDFMIRFSIGDVLSRSMAVLGKNFVPFFLMTGVVQLPQLIASAHLKEIQATGFQDLQQVLVTSLGVIALSIIVGPLATAMVTYGVLQQLRGRHATFGECIKVGLSRTLTVIGVAIATGLLTGLGALLCLIPGIYLATIWFVAAPAAVVERLGVGGAMDRSSQLTSGVRWSVFGLMVCIGLIGAAINLGFGFIIGAAGQENTLAGAVVDGVISVLVQAFFAVVGAVAYHDLRVEKEGVNSQDLAGVFD